MNEQTQGKPFSPHKDGGMAFAMGEAQRKLEEEQNKKEESKNERQTASREADADAYVAAKYGDYEGEIRYVQSDEDVGTEDRR